MFGSVTFSENLENEDLGFHFDPSLMETDGGSRGLMCPRDPRSSFSAWHHLSSPHDRAVTCDTQKYQYSCYNSREMKRTVLPRAMLKILDF